MSLLNKVCVKSSFNHQLLRSCWSQVKDVGCHPLLSAGNHQIHTASSHLVTYGAAHYQVPGEVMEVKLNN